MSVPLTHQQDHFPSGSRDGNGAALHEYAKNARAWASEKARAAHGYEAEGAADLHRGRLS